jgi:hypothetical protein
MKRLYVGYENNAIEGWRYVPTGPTRGARVD